MADIEGVFLVDGANWSAQLKEKGLRINYERLVTQVQNATGIKIIGYYYYTTYRSEEDLGRRWGFLNYLKDLGWQVSAMPATLGADGRWKDKEVDIAIALDAYEEVRSGKAGTVLIGSGDEDFAALFRRLPEGREGWIVSFRERTSLTLHEVANVLFLDDLNVVYKHSPVMGSPEEI